MIIFILLGVLAGLIALEIISVNVSMKNIRVTCDLDMELVEPDEPVTLRYTVYNYNRWPILFIGLFFYFADGISVSEDETFLKRFVKRSMGNQRLAVRLFLLPHRKTNGRVHFTMKTRGLYAPGRFYVEAGDFMGFKTMAMAKTEPSSIICTARLLENDDVIETLGGLLGDVSVRRFVFEDPNLLIGYHEYTGQDPMSKVSWTQTARMGHLMVKKNDFTVDNDVSVVVNMEKGGRELLEAVLSLTRTVCEFLESRKVPYAVITNSDLMDFPVGLGKGHLFQILKSIGISRLTCFESFQRLIDRCISGRNSNRGYILVMPKRDEDWDVEIERLQQHFDHPLCVLYAQREEVEE